IAYVEHIADGRAFCDQIRTVTERTPVVVVKGGVTTGGQRAAASHTGALATEDRVFDGAIRQAGVTRAATIEEAYEVAATFATQPLPAGPNTCIVTTAGGWGAVTARQIRSGRFFPDYGLERIANFHERQDQRFAEAAAEVSAATGKPVLTATELAVADPANPGPATVRATGKLCYPSANRAVTALDHLWRYARWRERRSL